MSRWRARAGENGATEMIKETLAAAVRNKVAKKGDFARVNVDTTVQEKNIRFPTDARTLDRARERVVSIGDKLNVMFAAIGFNLKKLMKGLKRLFFAFSQRYRILVILSARL